MRDPARIHRMLLKLEWLWEKYPDLRLGQLIINLSPRGFSNDRADMAWFVEDDHMEERIDTVLANGWSALQ